MFRELTSDFTHLRESKNILPIVMRKTSGLNSHLKKKKNPEPSKPCGWGGKTSPQHPASSAANTPVVEYVLWDSSQTRWYCCSARGGASQAGISQLPSILMSPFTIMKAFLHHIKRKVKLHKGTSHNSSRWWIKRQRPFRKRLVASCSASLASRAYLWPSTCPGPGFL